MKAFLTLLTLGLLVASCSKEPVVFSIDGQVANGDSVLVKLDAREQGEWITLDSSMIDGGSFSLTGSVGLAEMVYLKFIKGDEINYTTLFLENSQISITGDADDVDALAITGSATHDEFSEFSSRMDQVTAPYDTLYELLSLAGDELVKDSLEEMIQKVEKEEEAFVLKYISEHAASPIAPYIAMRSLSYYMEHDELKPVVDQIYAEQEGSKYLGQLSEILEKLKLLSIGAVAPDFTEADVNGGEFNLSSLKGKYVLLDFWASWCGPCRRENPNVVAMYTELGGDDFEIVGISLDKKEESWKGAIADDQLTWIHVSDLKGWKSAVADLYNVRAIPKTYLLDRDGNIVAKDLRGNELKAKIKELLDAQS